MKIEITNGTTVHRIYTSSHGHAEWVAAFQYEQDAEAFIQAQLENDTKQGRSAATYLMVATGNAKVRSFAPPPTDTGKDE